MTDLKPAEWKLYTARWFLVLGIVVLVLGAIGLVVDPYPWALAHLISILVGAACLAVAAHTYHALRHPTDSE